MLLTHVILLHGVYCMDIHLQPCTHLACLRHRCSGRPGYAYMPGMGLLLYNHCQLCGLTWNGDAYTP